MPPWMNFPLMLYAAKLGLLKAKTLFFQPEALQLHSMRTSENKTQGMKIGLTSSWKTKAWSGISMCSKNFGWPSSTLISTLMTNQLLQENLIVSDHTCHLLTHTVIWNGITWKGLRKSQGSAKLKKNFHHHHRNLVATKWSYEMRLSTIMTVRDFRPTQGGRKGAKNLSFSSSRIC